jgi:hypothetical protein
MRLSDQHEHRRLAGIPHRMVAVITLCGVAMPSMAADLVQALPYPWVSATALSLTLATAAIRTKN